MGGEEDRQRRWLSSRGYADSWWPAYGSGECHNDRQRCISDEGYGCPDPPINWSDRNNRARRAVQKQGALVVQGGTRAGIDGYLIQNTGRKGTVRGSL